QDRNPGTGPAPSRDAGGVASARHAVAGAAQSHRRELPERRRGARRRQDHESPPQHGALRRHHVRHAQVAAEAPMVRMLLPASFAAALALAVGAEAIGPAAAGDATRIAANPAASADETPTGSVRFAAGDPAARFVALGVGKSIVVDLSRD